MRTEGEPSGRLLEAIERLYDVFSSCSLPRAMTYCELCDGPDDERALHVPLRDLSPDVVSKYVFDAVHHTGDERDFKHFVPRIYELLAYRLLWADAQLVLSRLSTARWYWSWSPKEIDAMRSYLDALWLDRLATYAPDRPADAILIGLILAGRDAADLMTAWAEQTGHAPRAHLADTIVTHTQWVNASQAITDDNYLRSVDYAEACWAVSRSLSSTWVADALTEALEEATTRDTRTMIDEALDIHVRFANPAGPEPGRGYADQWLRCTEFANRTTAELQVQLAQLPRPFRIADVARIEEQHARSINQVIGNVRGHGWPRDLMPLLRQFVRIADRTERHLRVASQQTSSTWERWLETARVLREDLAELTAGVRAALGLPAVPDLA